MSKGKKRFWSDDEKREICGQARVEGASVAQVVRRYAMNANLIHKWLKDPRFAPVAEEPDEVIEASFLPVEVAVFGTSADEAAPDPELSKAVGKTTKRVVTRSRSIGRNPFAGRSMSKRTEETALLPGDEACRMDLDDIVMVVDAQMPVRAKRIKYYEDRFFKGIFDKQPDGSPDVQAYRNATARVDQFLENAV